MIQNAWNLFQMSVQVLLLQSIKGICPLIIKEKRDSALPKNKVDILNLASCTIILSFYSKHL